MQWFFCTIEYDLSLGIGNRGGWQLRPFKGRINDVGQECSAHMGTAGSSALLYLMHVSGLLGSGNCARGHSQTVPLVDGCDGQGQISEFSFAEVRADFFLNLVRDVSIGYAGDGFGPGQSATFAVSVIRRFAPRVETVEVLLAFADVVQIFPVHVDAISAAVDLRGAQAYKVEQKRFETGLVKIGFQAEYGAVSARSNFGAVKSRLHRASVDQNCP
jgi:hypothetical protein